MTSTYFSYFFNLTVGKLKISHVAQTWAKFNFLGQRAESNCFRDAPSQLTLPTDPKNKHLGLRHISFPIKVSRVMAVNGEPITTSVGVERRLYSVR